MTRQDTYPYGPFAILTFIYFVVGFLTTVNGQIQGPLKVTFLADAPGLNNTLTTMVSFFFFLGYLLNSNLGGRWINSHGYKSTLLKALGFMVAALAVYSVSSYIAAYHRHAHISIGGDKVPYGYFVFLMGSFLMGTSAAILQVVINPYIAAYKLPGTQPVQRMNIVCAINSLGTAIAPFFVTGVMFAGIPISHITAGQLFVPFMLIALCMLATTWATSRASLPDLSDTRTAAGKASERSVWSFTHLKYGVIAIFFYVGTEVSVGVNINLHAMEMINQGHALSFFGHERLELCGLELGIPALLATLYWCGMMAGRMFFSFFKSISPRAMLIGTTISATVLLAVAITTGNLWALAAVGLCHSVMWSAIFTLSVKGLKEYTSKASGAFMTGVFGGAVFPVIQGMAADASGSWRWTWLIAIVCEAVMLWYAIYGSKVKDAYCK